MNKTLGYIAYIGGYAIAISELIWGDKTHALMFIIWAELISMQIDKS